jgi:hypothetical protein
MHTLSRRIPTTLLLLLALAGLPPTTPAAGTAHAAQAAPAAATTTAAGAAKPSMPPEMDWLLANVRAHGDNAGAPYMVIDKRGARLWVFDAQGRVIGHAPVLLGYAEGDHTVPGIGDRPLDQVRPHEKTTPAGRFALEAGRNLRGETVLWVDYDAAVSMHQEIPGTPAERRAQRLASPTPADNRITYGCINVPTPFFRQVVLPNFARLPPGRAFVYVLPEVQTLQETFPWQTAPQRSAAPSAAGG